MQRSGPRRHIPRSLVRRILGWSLITLAALGVILPVLPGLPFLVIGILFLGPHDPTLRRIAVRLRMLVRRWSQVRQRHLRLIGRWVRRQYRETRLAVRAQLHRHQHGAEGWRAHLALLTVMLIGMTASAGILFAALKTIP